MKVRIKGMGKVRSKVAYVKSREYKCVMNAAGKSRIESNVCMDKCIYISLYVVCGKLMCTYADNLIFIF